MIALRLADVAAATGGRVDPAHAAIEVTAVTTDSRAVPDGALFVALKGLHHDGHDHVVAATTAGAIAYLAEREVDPEHPAVLVPDTSRALTDLAVHVRDRVDPLVVAITGSVGKTTTKGFTAAAVGAGRTTVASQGSYNNEVGVPLTCLALEADTQVLVAEVGSRGIGHVAELAGLLRPDVGVVTAVAPAHLEQFGDLDVVARAKGELVEALGHGGLAVLNADDARVAAMRARTQAQVLTFGIADGPRSGAGPDVAAVGITMDALARPAFRAVTPWGEADVRLPVAGRHHVANGLAALAVAGGIGLPIEVAAAGLAAAPPPTWRGEVIEVGGVVIINDAYNASPVAVEAALKTLRGVQRTGRAWAVLGTMAELGDASREAHDRIGRLCVRLGVDRLVVVGDDAWAIREGADLEGFFGADRWQVATVDDALAILQAHVEPGDAVLVKASRVVGLDVLARRLAEVLA